MEISENLPMATLSDLASDIRTELESGGDVNITISAHPEGYNLPTQQFLLVIINEAKNNAQLDVSLGDDFTLPLLEPVAQRIMEKVTE